MVLTVLTDYSYLRRRTERTGADFWALGALVVVALAAFSVVLLATVFLAFLAAFGSSATCVVSG